MSMLQCNITLDSPVVRETTKINVSTLSEFFQGTAATLGLFVLLALSLESRQRLVVRLGLNAGSPNACQTHAIRNRS